MVRLRRGGSSLELAIPLGLLALLGILAWLQYRWTGAVSRAEAERLKSSLESTLSRFSEDLDEELARIFRLFAVSTPEELSHALVEWREDAPYPELVDEVFSMSFDDGGRLILSKLDPDGAFRPVSWPEGFQEIREAMEWVRDVRPPRPGRPPGFAPPPRAPSGMPLVSHDPLGVFVPSFRERRREPPASLGSVVTLRRAALSEELLSDLVSRHFGSKEGLSYDVVVLDERGDVLFSTTENPGAVLHSPDASSPLFSLRRGFRRRSPVGPEGHFQAFVRHRAGSLEAAVEVARRRNLAVGLGILGILGVSVVLVTMSTRRARELSERKMEFVAGVSHELRTPLAVIRSAAQNLTDGSVSGPEQVRTYGALVDAQSRRLEDLVEQVLELAGIQSNRRRYRRERVSVRALVEGALADCEREAKVRPVPIETSLPPDDRIVLGEADALRRALANLVTNAVKHGGDDNVVSIDVGSEGGFVTLSVSDRGPGVSESERAHLFEPFFRGARARERQVPGSGLGLSLVEHVAREHGGRVEVSTGPGSGSRFSIVLPEAPGTGES